MASLENFRLTAFRAVATHLSFRKAAESLHLTQPAISAQIKALEDDLNIQIFDRTRGHVSLTEAGSILLDYANQAQQIFAQATASIDQLKGESSGILALGASTTIAQYALPRRLSEFCKRNHNVEVQIISGNTEQVVNALLEHRIALGLIEGPPRCTEVQTEPYLSDELLLIVPCGHEWAERGSIEARELRSAPLLLRERGSGTRDVVLTVLAKNNIHLNDLRIAMELDSTEAIKSSVAAGLGIGFVSRWALTQDSRTGREFSIVAIEGIQISRSFLLVSLHGQKLQGASEAFRRFLLAEVPA